MATTIDDWNSIETNQRGAKKESDIIFLKAKYLPITLIPSTSQIYQYFSYYDTDEHKSKRCDEGDGLAKTEYAFHAIVKTDDNEKKVKVCICGSMVFNQIKQLIKTTKSLAPDSLPVIRIWSDGSGMSTRYYTDHTGDTVPALLWAKYQAQADALPLDHAVARLLGEDAPLCQGLQSRPPEASIRSNGNAQTDAQANAQTDAERTIRAALKTAEQLK